MTPQLRQAIKILQVSRAELETLVDDELTQNPVLEEQQADEKPESEVPTVDGQETHRGVAHRGARPRRRPAGVDHRPDRLAGVRRELRERHARLGRRRGAGRRRRAPAGAREHAGASHAPARSPRLAAPAVGPLRRRQGARRARHRQPRRRRLPHAVGRGDRVPRQRLAAHRGGRARPAPHPGVRPAGRRGARSAGVPAASSCASSASPTTRCRCASCAITWRCSRAGASTVSRRTSACPLEQVAEAHEGRSPCSSPSRAATTARARRATSRPTSSSRRSATSTSSR